MPNGVAAPQMSMDATKSAYLIILLQVLGTIVLFAGGFFLYQIINAGETSQTLQLVGFIFLGIAVIVGLVGLWGSLPFEIIELSELEIVPSLNNLMVMATVLFFILASIVGIWGSRMYTDVGKLGSWDLFAVLIFSFCVVTYLELASTSNHFYSVKKFAKKHNLKKENLNINMLSGKYLVWFFVLFSIVFVYSWFVLDLQNVIIAMMGDGYVISPTSIGGLSHQFANSLILNSIYGVALSMAIVFIPFTILILLIFGGKEKEEEQFESDDMM